jgi:hypothetical protein
MPIGRALYNESWCEAIQFKMNVGSNLSVFLFKIYDSWVSNTGYSLKVVILAV